MTFAIGLLFFLILVALVLCATDWVEADVTALVSGMLTQYQLAPMGMFELAPVGIPIAVAGLVYMMTIGRRIIPDRFREDEISATSRSLREYLSEVVVLPGSALAGMTIAESGFGRAMDLTVLRIGIKRRPSPRGATR